MITDKLFLTLNMGPDWMVTELPANLLRASQFLTEFADNDSKAFFS